MFLFLTLTTSLVNAHGLSHLFDGDSSSIEHCTTCDEFVLSHHDKISFTAPVFDEFKFHTFEIKTEITPSQFSGLPDLVHKPGKYFNKPPPFKLV